VNDSLRPFGQVVLAIRWGTTAISLVLASPDIQDGDLTVTLCMVALAALSAYRTWRPLRYDRALASMATLVLELGVTVLGLAVTGYWESPFVFSLLTCVAVAGFARGFAFALRLATASVLAVSLAWGLSEADAPDKPRSSAEWAGEVILVALVAGFARRISGEADERRVQALDRLGRLNDANVLLFQLHQVTQTLPASLDLDEVLDTTLDQVRDLFDAASVALLLRDEADGTWHTARRLGGPPGRSYLASELPGPVGRSERLRSALREDDLQGQGGPGVDPTARSGLYAVLEARGATIGLLALEHGADQHFTERDLELLGGFVDPVALAIDNARWFERLRTVGAAEERTRIARELHDRIGQSLAYVAFELDRLTKKAGDGVTDLGGSLDALRGDVRSVIGELRDTLYDLRTEVTAAEGLAEVLPRFLERVETRSSLRVSADILETARLPILQERELWRIAQELVAHIERQGRGSQLEVTWRSDGARGELTVAHRPADGAGSPSPIGTTELTALRERAASIGATVAVDHDHATGTRVRCTLTGR
jgi:signal transduction histidine kinase